MPPQLSLHVASGHASVGPAGEVLVYPGSIFHIDCLFDRRKGNPQWTLSKPGKKYATGEIYFSKRVEVKSERKSCAATSTLL